MTQRRKSNFDILKIIAIFGIILHHYALWTKWDFQSGLQLNKIVVNTLLIGGKLGVNLFIMITGFFMINSKIKLKSILSIWIDTTVISVILYLVLVIFHVEGITFSFDTFIRRLFPVLFNQYWFVTSYTLMYFSIPIVNKLIKGINSKNFKHGLFLGFVILSLYPYIYFEKGMTFSFPIWFIYLYCVGAYISMNEEFLKKYSFISLVRNIVVLFIVCVGLNVILQLILNNPSLKINGVITLLNWHENIFYTKDCSPLLLLIAINVFILFLKFDIKYHSIYSKLSRGAFGVYLLQSAPWFSTSVLWPIIVRGQRFTSSKIIVAYGILIVLAIYIIGLLIYFCILPLCNFLLKYILKKIDKI